MNSRSVFVLISVLRLRVKELQAENESLAEYTNQKLSALLKQLVGENKVERIEEKRVAKFKKVVDNQ